MWVLLVAAPAPYSKLGEPFTINLYMLDLSHLHAKLEFFKFLAQRVAIYQIDWRSAVPRGFLDCVPRE